MSDIDTSGIIVCRIGTAKIVTRNPIAPSVPIPKCCGIGVFVTLFSDSYFASSLSAASEKRLRVYIAQFSNSPRWIEFSIPTEVKTSDASLIRFRRLSLSTHTHSSSMVKSPYKSSCQYRKNLDNSVTRPSHAKCLKIYPSAISYK